MEWLDERSGSVWSKHVDKQGIIRRVKTAKAEANKEERRQEEPEGGYPRYEEEEEAGAQKTKGKEGQLLPTLLDVQTEDEAGDDRCYASAKGTSRPDEVYLFVRDSNLRNNDYRQSEALLIFSLSRVLTWVARKGCVGPRIPIASPRQTWPAQARGR